MAMPYINNGMSVLDIGCSNGELFQNLISEGLNFKGVGVDPDIKEDLFYENYKLFKDVFPSGKISGKFDIITALAVLEHIPENEINLFIESCKNCLNDEGKIILTVPHQFVDKILKVLESIKIIDGMETGQHYGFDSSKTVMFFSRNGLKLIKHKYFQLGLNNLFVFSF